jgi:tetratricopeptide (TPR) repeat protein
MPVSGSSDPQANALAAQARHLARQELEVERRAAADLFRQAIERDPQFGLAYAGLADVLVQIARWRLPDWQETAEEALAAATKAVELAPDLADSHLALGAVLAMNHDPKAADTYARALTISPDDANVHYRMARFLVLLGDKAGALLHYERAFELDPDDYRYVVYALQEYQALGDRVAEQSCLRRSAEAIERHLKRQPSDVRALGHGAGVMALLGRSEDMQRMIGRALKLRPTDYGNLTTLACAAMLNGDKDQALDLLERAAATGEGDREWLLADNDLKPLHGDPRFEALVSRVGRHEPPHTKPDRPAERRRLLMAGGAVAVLAAGGLAGWQLLAPAGPPSQAKLLLQKGIDALQSNDALETDDVGSTMQAIAFLTDATEADPRSATAWGALAMAYAVRRKAAPVPERSGLEQRSLSAVAKATALDPHDPYSAAAQRLLDPLYRNWSRAEQANREAVRRYPQLPIFLFIFSEMLGSVGRWKEAAVLSRKADRTNFLIPGADRRVLINLWSAGDLEGADKALSMAAERWPQHPTVWRTRIAYLFYSGRPAEGLAVLDNEAERPPDTPPQLVTALRAIGQALAGRGDRGEAAAEALSYLKARPSAALPVVHALTSLGAADTALELLRGYYFAEGDWRALAPPGGDQDRLTGPLFQPPMRSLWRQPEFDRLLTRIGLNNYWRESGTVPDYRGA